MTLHLKGFGGIDQSASRFTHRIGIPHIHVAAQPDAQQRIEPSVYGYDMVTLPRQAAKQLGARNHR